MLRRASLLIVGTGLAVWFGLTAWSADAEEVTGRASKTSAKSVVDPFAPPAWVKAATRPTGTTQPTTRPVEGVDHVLIISIDGCRPDMLLRNDTRNVHELFRTGTFTFWAKTTPNSITLPSHTSMLTGVNPRKHGIEWNRDLPLSRPIYPLFPTVFYYAKKAGYTTGMAAGKSKFDFLAADGTLDYQSIPNTEKIKDSDVAGAAVKIITEGKPSLMFVHLPGVDNVGHKDGWGSPEQCEAIVGADRAVGRILNAVADAGLEDRTIVIVTADHGGAGKGHGPDDPRSRHIPWICHGPGVRKNLDLTTDADLEVHTEDTFATACWLLGIPLDPKKVEGKPIIAAFRAPDATAELLKDDAETPQKAEKTPESEKSAQIEGK